MFLVGGRPASVEVPTAVLRNLAPCFPDSAQGDDRSLRDRLERLEVALRKVRREAAELRASYDDAIELALIGAVPNGIVRLVADVRGAGLLVSYRRGTRRTDFGAIGFDQPGDAAHGCTIQLPVPHDEPAQRGIEMDVRMRIGLLQAA